jgi:uncharacterized protein (TIGR03066 family)
LLLLFIATSLACRIAAHADDDLQKRLVGTWLETRFETRSKQVKESDNLITFAADGTMKLHLKKEEAKGGQRSLDGTWKVESGSALKMEIAIDEKKQEQTMQLSFEGEEMILTDPDGRRTWHKRHEGPLPDRYQR